ncbi:zinc finger domain-containing protein [Mycobacterium avium]|uniref:zinc finger domain-containing protein n=1 Tax=Mycobacterium avium TaxID=1764 RepID=UPI0007A0DA30|nr:hypothetical protein [Mycobacterium avium]MBZ4518372.1 hypothetical protein [Mycobacterium avium subsp. hominissuis]MBZ4528241.1 hypothetical protein [Mycobacterium avium subsp. hominissuis]MBZ4547457.1 hypothetical protein [Mycobacterium avium subsp. hominissuis]MBZ4557190.1 hypothetical protein [Mycobacterium avium subsp. hominissuis]MBZ4566843.1 hypothetical protein [Mycobacterium avium subsp. hominissuis]
MTINWPQTAANVYQACTAYDQYLPALSEDVARAWAKTFACYNLSLDDLLAGVDQQYATAPPGYRPLPGDIAQAARAIRRERTEAESDAERQAREDRRDAALEAKNRARMADVVEAITQHASIPVAAHKSTRPQHNPLSVACPWCKATVARACTNAATGNVTNPHPSRVEAYQASLAGAA